MEVLTVVLPQELETPEQQDATLRKHLFENIDLRRFFAIMTLNGLMYGYFLSQIPLLASETLEKSSQQN